MTKVEFVSLTTYLLNKRKDHLEEFSTRLYDYIYSLGADCDLLGYWSKSLSDFTIREFAYTSSTGIQFTTTFTVDPSEGDKVVLLSWLGHSPTMIGVSMYTKCVDQIEAMLLEEAQNELDMCAYYEEQERLFNYPY